MKIIYRLMLLAFGLILTGINFAASAQQTKIVTGHPDLKIRVTRCEANGNTAVIDLLVENVGSKDVSLALSPYYTVAYDDEGDKFSEGKITIQLGDFTVVGTSTNRLNGRPAPREMLPVDIPLKARIQIEGVPESATEFKRIDLSVDCNAWNLNDKKPIKITNVPIHREGDE